MSNADLGKKPQEVRGQDVRARHGVRSEVNWEGGSGRQPYSNQGAEESDSPSDATEFAEGDRGDLSGRNLEQIEEAKGKP